LKATQPEVEIEVVEVLTNPMRALRDKVMMIPVIIIGETRWYHAPPLSELLSALRKET
jgi:hypothetical protein